VGELTAIAPSTPIHSIVLAHLDAVNSSVGELLAWLDFGLHVVVDVVGVAILVFLKLFTPRALIRKVKLVKLLGF